MLGYNTPMGKNHTTTSFGARLAELGRARGLDTGQIAYRAGLSYNYVYSLIQGRRVNPVSCVSRKALILCSAIHACRRARSPACHAACRARSCFDTSILPP